MSVTDTPPVAKTAADYRAEAAARRLEGGAPRSGRSRSAAPPPPAPSELLPEDDTPTKLTPKWKGLREGVLELYTAAQMACFMFDADTAVLIQANKEKCADAWIDLAKKDAKVANLLTKLTTGSAWGGLVMAHVGIIIPIFAKKGIIPGGALFADGALFDAMNEPEPEPPTSDEFVDMGFVPAA